MRPKYLLIVVATLLLFYGMCKLTILSDGQYKSTTTFFDIVNIEK